MEVSFSCLGVLNGFHANYIHKKRGATGRAYAGYLSLTQCYQHNYIVCVWERESMMVFLARCCSVILVVLRLTLLRRRWHNWHKRHCYPYKKHNWDSCTEKVTKGRIMVVFRWPLHARCPLVWSLWVVDMQLAALEEKENGRKQALVSRLHVYGRLV